MLHASPAEISPQAVQIVHETNNRPTITALAEQHGVEITLPLTSGQHERSPGFTEDANAPTYIIGRRSFLLKSLIRGQSVTKGAGNISYATRGIDFFSDSTVAVPVARPSQKISYSTLTAIRENAPLGVGGSLCRLPVRKVTSSTAQAQSFGENSYTYRIAKVHSPLPLSANHGVYGFSFTTLHEATVQSGDRVISRSVGKSAVNSGLKNYPNCKVN